MRAVAGEVNDSCYLHFSVDIANVTNVWTNDKAIVRGSTTMNTGRFKAIENDVAIPDRAYVNIRDISTNIQIVLKESKIEPLLKIKVGLPNKDKYVVSDFFAKGHFEIERINVVSHQKTFDGETVMAPLREGKTVNLLNKLIIEYEGEPMIKFEKIDTSVGTLVQIKTSSNLEI